MPDPARNPFQSGFRLGLAGRLGIGFSLIAVVLLLGHSAAQRDMRAAIETLRETQTAQVPLTRVADALTYRVAAFDRAVLAEIRSPSNEVRPLLGEAEDALFASLDSYAGLRPSAADQIAELRAEAEEHTRLGWSLIDIGAKRQSELADMRGVLDVLARRVSTAFGQNAQLPDPALTRRAYAELELELGRLRSALNDYLVSGSSEAGKTLVGATRSFGTVVAAHRDGLARSPGRAWVELLEEDYARIRDRQRQVLQHDATISALRDRFTESGLQLPLRLDAALAAPASRAVVESTGSAADAASSAESAISRLTYLVLAATLLVSLATIFTVTRPVRRLTQATRALAEGRRRVRVPPGGSAELEELGEAFNQMAERLAIADEQAFRHRQELEQRVRTRTRKLTHLANHDPLTGLPNRRLAFNHLRRALRSARRRDELVCLITLDIDNFKVINDSFGHVVGDSLLIGVAERLRLLAGPRRFIARLGGDEFVVSIERAEDPEEASAMAERIISGFRAPLRVGGRDILVSVSIGIARAPEDATEAGDLVRAADAALFRAKALGRSRIASFTPALLEDSEARFALEQSLRRAVEARQLQLVYQPQVSLVDGRTTGAEALLRWKRSDGAPVTAGEFIAIAEQSGLIIEIGEWVLETAAAAVAGWRDQGFGDACVAINVSVHQLLDNRFVDKLARVLEDFALPADAIELELTETAFQTSASTIEALRLVREGGVGLALDDFGTGYSSLISLSRLPIRRVKIDRSLVAEAPASQRAESLARSIIGVCHNLGLAVTVEGIERPEQLAWLSGCGPVHVQGFVVARPIDAADIPAFARGSRRLLAELLQPDSGGGDGRRWGDPVVPFRPGSGSGKGRR